MITPRTANADMAVKLLELYYYHDPIELTKRQAHDLLLWIKEVDKSFRE
jgi:hypothetical protein